MVYKQQNASWRVKSGDKSTKYRHSKEPKYRGLKMVKTMSAGCVNTGVAGGVLITSDYISQVAKRKLTPMPDQKQEINFVWTNGYKSGP